MTGTPCSDEGKGSRVIVHSNSGVFIERRDSYNPLSYYVGKR